MPGPRGTPFSPPGGFGPGNTISIELLNAGGIIGRFKQLAAGLQTQSDRLTETVADSIAMAAKDLVAKDERKVEKSIRVERQAKSFHSVIADRLGERDEVPIYLEIGTARMAARPFMKPAADLVLAAGGIQRAAVEIGGLLPPMSAVGRGR